MPADLQNDELPVPAEYRTGPEYAAPRLYPVRGTHPVDIERTCVHIGFELFHHPGMHRI